MNEREIINGNKIIAEFEGWEQNPEAPDWMILNCPKQATIPFECLNYNHSWQLLMRVWVDFRQKVWGLFYESYPDEFSTFREGWEAACFNGNSEQAHQELVRAITWYNTTKSNTENRNENSHKA